MSYRSDSYYCLELEEKGLLRFTVFPVSSHTDG